MTFAHQFINISQNIFNLWMRLIFPDTRHLGFQFEHKNEAIPIRIKSDMIFRSWLYMLLQQLRENWTLLAPHSHQSFHLMYQIFPKAKMRSRFMILCQTSLNGPSIHISFTTTIYTPPLIHFKTHKNRPFSPLLSSRKFSSLVISWSSWDLRYWVRLTLPFLTLLFLYP